MRGLCSRARGLKGRKTYSKVRQAVSDESLRLAGLESIGLTCPTDCSVAAKQLQLTKPGNCNFSCQPGNL